MSFRNYFLHLGNLGGGDAYMYLYGWVPLLSTWNYHNIVNQPWKVKVLLCCVWLFLTPWTVAHKAPLSMGFFSQEYHSETPGPSPGDLPNPGMEPGPRALQADSLPSEPILQYKTKAFFLKKKEIISFLL